MNATRGIFAAAGLMLGLLVLYAFAQQQDDGANATPGEDLNTLGTRVGEIAPSFTAKRLDGQTIRFPDDFRGKLVLLDFWATWCAPCRGELPHVRELREKLQGRGFEVVGISLDQSQNVPEDRFRDFLKKNEIVWPQVYDQAGNIAMRYRVTAIPAPFLIDGDSGRILAKGGTLLGKQLEPTVTNRLKPATKP